MGIRCVVAVLLTVCLSVSTSGFYVDLIHRDSPKSPLYDPSLTPTQRISNAARRSIERAEQLKPKAAEASIVGNGGEYLMEYWVGSPKVRILGIADTGSDLIWTQCSPCSSCYNQTAPLFDPSRSSSFTALPCHSARCSALPGTSCAASACHYQAAYGDGSFTKGDVATETLTLGSTTSARVVLRNATIGCGHSNAGTFAASASGIVGLGGGAASLITQMGSSIGGKFSYCLLPLGSEDSSKLSFGSSAEVSGPGTVSTALVAGGDTDTFYRLTLDAVSVGKKRIEFSAEEEVEKGNIIIDSGTTLTLLPPDFYASLESALVEAISAERISNPSSGLSLCYAASGPAAVGAPPLTVHFDGADVQLSASNAFVLAAQNEVCFAFAPSQSLSIYGNLSQMDFLVGYDREAMTVSFKPTECVNT